MDYLYGYLSNVGAESPAFVIEKNGVQFLKEDVAGMVMALLQQRYLVSAGTPSTEKVTQFFAVTKEKLAEQGISTENLPTAASQISKQQGYVLVTADDINSLAATPVEAFKVLYAADLETAKTFSKEGYAVLSPLTSKAEEKPTGIKTAAIIGAAVGAGVGALVAGVPGAIIGGIGAGVLAQQVA